MYPLSILLIIGITTDIVVAETKCKPPGWIERMTRNDGVDYVYKHFNAHIHDNIGTLESVPIEDFKACSGQEEPFEPGQEVKYMIPDELLTPNATNLKGGYVVCREDGSILKSDEISAIEKLQMESCGTWHGIWGKHVGSPRKEFSHGHSEAFQCDYTSLVHMYKHQTCNPEVLAVMLLLVNRFCHNYPGWFSMESWDVTYGRQRREDKKPC
ncbi:hypothetical protein EJ05DRAFT_488025 [Pseudovirgaria hyperparasitica]|uniref:Uncharacterized protein n=1 Tax=Pseudovirgaria hyperparasitica TaxID=470096 RepID=A0A6A6W2Q4_9PEZI|nr:uncharacterized protein EJ05DRAFT_488025 [Pseudovirgaria hyperparasitica]KAF2756240.1 hypothetical protein EJ05DRAFT_488025 [Pseudovirgaria hyperparasitica]